MGACSRLFEDFRACGNRSLLVLSTGKSSLCDGPVQRELEVRRINDGEQLSRLHEIPFARSDANDFARHQESDSRRRRWR